MTLLLDQGLPRTTTSELKKVGITAIHVGEFGMASATDSEILEQAISDNLIVVTLDSDFHMLMANRQLSWPSVVRVRIEGLKAKEFAKLIHQVVNLANEDILAGSAISVTDKGIRIKRLPLV